MKSLVFASLFLASAARAEGTWTDDLTAALAAAKAKHSLVLVDFYAPWCYSCYYMDQNVLNQPAFQKLKPRLEPVKMDVDSPQGSKLKKDWKVRFLPSYVLLNADGQEVGRILGEQTRSDYFSRLEEVLSKNSTLDDLKKGLEAESPEKALPRIREVLSAHYRRSTHDEGLAWFNGLPEALRKAASADKECQLSLYRLTLRKDAASQNAAGCRQLAPALLGLSPDCEIAYDAGELNSCLEKAAWPWREQVYRRELRKLGRVLDTRVFVKPADRCADILSPVETVVDANTAMSLKEDGMKVLDRAIEQTKKDLGGDLAKDRNKADNLRVFLDMAGKTAELDELYPKLIAAYPDDYVYSFRFAKSLLARGHAADALPRYEAALAKAYGANRLKVIEGRAKALAALGRKDDAVKDVEAALKDNPASFPDEIASLSRLKDELQKTH